MRHVAVAHGCWEAYNTALDELCTCCRGSPTRAEFWARVVGESGLGLPVHAGEVGQATMSHEEARKWMEERSGPATREGPSAHVQATLIVEDDELADMD